MRISRIHWRNMVQGLMLLLIVVASTTVYAQEEEGETGGQGLDALVPVFEVHDQPLKEVLGLLSKFSNLNFLMTKGVEDVKITATLTDITVRNILEESLPAYGLRYHRPVGQDFVKIMTEQKWEEEHGAKPVLKTKVFTIKYAEFGDVSRVVQNIKGDQGTQYHIPAQRRIIVNDTPEILSEIEDTVKKLDQVTQTRRFELKYIDVSDAMSQMRGLIPPDSQIQVDEVSNVLIVTDLPERLRQIEEILEMLDKPRLLKVFEIQYADPEDIISMIESMKVLTERATVESDLNTNKILIQDIPSRLEMAARVVKALDSPPLQVYIEAEILQITMGRVRDLGLDWAYGRDVSVSGATDALDLTGQNLLFQFISGQLGVTDFASVGDRNLKYAIQALENMNVAKIVSQPFGLVRNHQELYFQDGSEEPFLVRQHRYSAGVSTGSDIYTQRTRSVGRILSVVPHANSSGQVYMEIVVEDSNARNVTVGGQTLLAVDEKSVETYVDVKTGHTVALGGIIREEETKGMSGIPGLMHLPLLGRVFRTENVDKDRRKLLILITPRVTKLEDPWEQYEEEVLPRDEGLEGWEFNWDDEAGLPLGEDEGIIFIGPEDEVPMESMLEEDIPIEEGAFPFEGEDLVPAPDTVIEATP